VVAVRRVRCRQWVLAGLDQPSGRVAHDDGWAAVTLIADAVAIKPSASITAQRHLVHQPIAGR
jgi:hypothetical protein